MCFGLVYSFGVFIKPIEFEYGWSRSAISGAFSTYAIIHNVLAFFAGRLLDRLGPKVVLAIAGLFLGFSMLIMSDMTSVWELYFYYGLIFSVGVACTYAPMMATVSWWFEAKRGLAIGLTTAGLGAGSMVFSPLVAWLISCFGLKRSFNILGIITLVVFIPIIIFIRQAKQESKRKENGQELIKGLSFREAFWTRTFWALCFCWAFIAVALWAIMIHIVSLATDRGLSIVSAGNLAGLIGASSFIGRISAGFLSDHIGRKRILNIAFVIQLLITIWLLVSSEVWQLFLFAIIFGLSSGSWAGVIPAFPADYFGSRATGAIIGFSVSVAGTGVALGAYMGGYIFDVTNSYNYMIIICSFATIAAIITAFFIRPLKV